MDFQIRAFAPEDYPRLVAIRNIVFPEYASTEDEQRYWDEHRDPAHKHRRWVAEHEGEVVAVAEYGQSFDQYHPRKFWIYGAVHPDFQHQGIGSALYEQVIEGLRQYDPISLRVELREDRSSSIRFMETRGFRDVWRSWESRLDVTTFDPTPYAGLEEKLRAQGIEIKNLKELEDDPERNHKLNEMDNELVRDIPSFEEITPLSYEGYMEILLNNPQLVPEAFFVAVHNGEYIGRTSLWVSEASPILTNNLTGVKRPYRHRRIALALKLRGIAYAKERGYPKIKTWNDAPNKAMISINERLGFVREVGWITLLREF